MRIVSQQRNMSFNFDSIELWTQDNYIYAKIGNDSKVIGFYKSEERTSEVFQDIHSAYSGLNSVVFQNIDIPDDLLAEMRNQPGPIIVRTERDNQKVEMLPTVYYMPGE